VEGIASRMHFTQPDIDDLKLAVGEACTNAIKHGCPSRHHPFITIICKVMPESLEIEVRNGLSGGQPCPSFVPVPDTSKEGGMGLFLMRKLMDEVDVIWKNRTASVRMVKRMKSAGIAPK
jgi:serine/threonine-protein kinase RsbW